MSSSARGFKHPLSPLPLLFLLLFLALSAPLVQAAQEGQGQPAILLVAFGTSVPEAAEAYARLDAKVHAAFPGQEVRWAYTSHLIRKKLAEQGQEKLSPGEALKALAKDGYTRVAVQSLHIIPGQEFHDLVREVRGLEGQPGAPAKVRLGEPLLSRSEDLERMAQALVKDLAPQRRKGEALALMGHGTHHPGGVYYAAMQHHLARLDKNVILGTVEGTPDLEDVLAALAARKVRTVHLAPLMTVAGDHAHNDMAGDEPDSWKSRLTKAGFKVKPILRGVAFLDAAPALWVEHLRAALESF